ncbi:hypothetical protein QBC47DRAFT_101119 [Echria macrotheca]|uniref:Uncharacterized protein n=1 Tax=Echria macrotheca TaxID=438768 RepID=A0AAJ0BLF8_9PEZI|nr:hypothetical protein QBC47DRAFT_101119 [Echria macrotheca]
MLVSFLPPSLPYSPTPQAIFLVSIKYIRYMSCIYIYIISQVHDQPALLFLFLVPLPPRPPTLVPTLPPPDRPFSMTYQLQKRKVINPASPIPAKNTTVFLRRAFASLPVIYIHSPVPSPNSPSPNPSPRRPAVPVPIPIPVPSVQPSSPSLSQEKKNTTFQSVKKPDRQPPYKQKNNRKKRSKNVLPAESILVYTYMAMACGEISQKKNKQRK